MFKLFLPALILATSTVLPQPAPAALATHCRAGEQTLLTARMQSIVRGGGGYRLKPLGKILSLCANRAQEPITRLIYRYGAPGRVELEQVADAAHPFGLFSRSTGPRMGEDTLFFSVKGFTYYVSQATGMGSGVSLRVFQNGRQLVDLFSGNDPDADFASGPATIAFDRPMSPVVRKQTPRDNWRQN